jgi:dihydrofolate reductase
MRKVILGLAVSLDGYIARENGDVDWLSMEDLSEAADESKEFFGTVDTIIFGRKTYEKGLELGGGAIPGKTNYVFSHTLPEGEHKNINFVSENVKGFVEKLKQQEGKNILLMGGGNLAKTFFEEKLIDTIILGIQPKIIGRGIPLFLPHDRQTELQLIDVKTRQSGTVQVTYLVK